MCIRDSMRSAGVADDRHVRSGPIAAHAGAVGSARRLSADGASSPQARSSTVLVHDATINHRRSSLASRKQNEDILGASAQDHVSHQPV